jgi:uncharacterized metal-binding protein
VKPLYRKENAMNAEESTFQIQVERAAGLCPAGERYAEQQMREGRIPLLSCEGPCIRGEIARQAAHRIGRQPPFARACQGEAVAVPDSGMARWVREAKKVVVLDGCFLRCQARMMRRMLRPDQLVEIDALPFYRKYVDSYEIDSVPEEERSAAAEEVARGVLARLSSLSASAAAGGCSGNAACAGEKQSQRPDSLSHRNPGESRRPNPAAPPARCGG